jgi:hypothetical protein
LATLRGAGSLGIYGGVYGAVTANGDGSLALREVELGALTLNDTVAGTAWGVRRGAATGTGTLNQNPTSGTAAVVASATVAVAFGCARSNNQYGVYLEASGADTPWVSGKTAAGFTIEFSLPVTTAVRWLLSE